MISFLLVVVLAATVSAIPIEQAEIVGSSIIPDILEKTTIKSEIESLEKIEPRSSINLNNKSDSELPVVDKKVIDKEIAEEKIVEGSGDIDSSIKKDVIDKVETSTVRDFEKEEYTLYEEIDAKQLEEDENISLPNKFGTRIFIEKPPPPKTTQKIIICSPGKKPPKVADSNKQDDDYDDDDDDDDDGDDDQEPSKKSKRRKTNKNKVKNKDKDKDKNDSFPEIIIQPQEVPNVRDDEKDKNDHRRRPPINRRPIGDYYEEDYDRRRVPPPPYHPQVDSHGPIRRPDRYDDIYHDNDRRRPIQPESSHSSVYDDYYTDDIRRPYLPYENSFKDDINRRRPLPPSMSSTSTTTTTTTVRPPPSKRPLVLLRPTSRPLTTKVPENAEEIYEVEHVYELEDIPGFSSFGKADIIQKTPDVPADESRLIKIEKPPQIVLVCKKKKKKPKDEIKEDDEEENLQDKPKEKPKEKPKDKTKVVVVYPVKPTVTVTKKQREYIQNSPYYIYHDSYPENEHLDERIIPNTLRQIPIIAAPAPLLHLPAFSIQAGISGNPSSHLMQNEQQPNIQSVPHLSAHVILHPSGTIPNREQLALPSVPHFAYVQAQFGDKKYNDQLRLPVADSVKPSEILIDGIKNDSVLPESEKKSEILINAIRFPEKNRITINVDPLVNNPGISPNREIPKLPDIGIVVERNEDKIKEMEDEMKKDVEIAKDREIKTDVKDDKGMMNSMMSDSKMEDDKKDDMEVIYSTNPNLVYLSPAAPVLL